MLGIRVRSFLLALGYKDPKSFKPRTTKPILFCQKPSVFSFTPLAIMELGSPSLLSFALSYRISLNSTIMGVKSINFLVEFASPYGSS
uniref:Uncharacterized protein n=1 Tax=Pyxicephalus adspersus TaxID=30357 RepID=A0AAV3A7R4_PYXAD|nr:TPA: hypothetical protein GDO54_011389 [Pyxicephalus adspersus]